MPASSPSPQFSPIRPAETAPTYIPTPIVPRSEPQAANYRTVAPPSTRPKEKRRNLHREPTPGTEPRHIPAEYDADSDPECGPRKPLSHNFVPQRRDPRVSTSTAPSSSSNRNLSSTHTSAPSASIHSSKSRPSSSTVQSARLPAASSIRDPNPTVTLRDIKKSHVEQGRATAAIPHTKRRPEVTSRHNKSIKLTLEEQRIAAAIRRRSTAPQLPINPVGYRDIPAHASDLLGIAIESISAPTREILDPVPGPQVVVQSTRDTAPAPISTPAEIEQTVIEADFYCSEDIHFEDA